MDPETYRILFEAQCEKKNVRLVNTYRGVPITANGQLVELHGNDAKINTNSLQILCGRSKKTSFLNFGHRIYKAHVVSSDLINETIDFTDFEVCKQIIGVRKFIRVEPKNPIRAQVTSPRFNTGERVQDNWFNTNLVDLSIHGAAIHLHALILEQTPVYIDDSATLKFDLMIPSTTATFQAEIKSTVRNITPVDENTIRIGFQTFSDPTTENMLSSFVAHLQKIIIQELKEKLNRETPVS